jgi:hypothetical protein
MEKAIKHLDELVRRSAVEIEHHANMPLAARLRSAWVILRSKIKRRWRMDDMSKAAQNDHEEYIRFWETHLEEMYELTEGGIITHDGSEEQGWWEVYLF